MKNPLRNFLTRLIWDKKLRAKEFKIVFISRGSPGDIEVISSKQIVSVGKTGFEYITSRGERKYIPFHRIREIREEDTGKKVFSKEKSIYNFKV